MLCFLFRSRYMATVLSMPNVDVTRCVCRDSDFYGQSGEWLGLGFGFCGNGLVFKSVEDIFEACAALITL